MEMVDHMATNIRWNMDEMELDNCFYCNSGNEFCPNNLSELGVGRC